MFKKLIFVMAFCFMILSAGSSGPLFPFFNYFGTMFFGVLFVVTGLKFLP